VIRSQFNWRQVKLYAVADGMNVLCLPKHGFYACQPLRKFLANEGGSYFMAKEARRSLIFWKHQISNIRS